MRLGSRLRIRLNHLHAWAYATTGGRAGGSIAGHRVLLLTTTGRRTGRARRTPVQFETLVGDLFVIASAAGAPRPPAWWRNIQADPRVTVRIGRHEHGAVAQTVDYAERGRVWPALCERNRHLAPIQRKARRELPVVRLELGPAEQTRSARA
jgi:deazaflavin-dependent oxidoreductase (nitroreductase family)